MSGQKVACKDNALAAQVVPIPGEQDVRRTAIIAAAGQIDDLMDGALDHDLSNDAPVIAMLVRTKALVSAVMSLLDETADPHEEDVQDALATIYLGLR